MSTFKTKIKELRKKFKERLSKYKKLKKKNNMIKIKELLNQQPEALTPLFSAKHQLTHQTLYAVFWKVSGKQTKPNANKGFTKVPVNDIHTFAVPRLLERFLDTILP